MNKHYDKISLAVGVLALIGGCAVYFMASAPDTAKNVSVGSNAYVPVAAPNTTADATVWAEPEAQPSGFIYDVFTPYEIYLDKDGNFTQEGPNITVTGYTFGNPYLMKLERELYRIQLEGYIEEDPTDPTKVLILFLNAETGMSVRGRIGQNKAAANFSVVDFKIEREDRGGAIIKTAIATIRDDRTGQEVVLNDSERRFNDDVTVVIGSKDDSALQFEFKEAGANFQTSTGNYVLEEINLEDSTVTVKKLGDDLNEPIIETLTVDSPTTTDNTPITEPTNSSSNDNSIFDAVFQ